MIADNSFDEVIELREQKTLEAKAPEKRAILAKALHRAFEFWELSPEDRLTLLGYAKDNRAALGKLAKGEPLGATQDSMDRASHVLGIWKSLELLFPRNDDFRSAWMRSRNKAFGNHTPVDVVRAYGLPGLVIVRGTLDMMRG